MNEPRVPEDTLRVELRLRNNVLWHAIFDRWSSVAAFCEDAVGVSQSEVGRYLNLKKSPYVLPLGLRKYRPRWIALDEFVLSQTAQRVADHIGMIAEDLFPRDLYADCLGKQFVVELPHERLTQLLPEHAEQLAIPPSFTDQVEAKDYAERVMSVLTPKEQFVIRRRFGLDEREETYAEIGQETTLTSERIRQIEAAAFRKMRRRHDAMSDCGADRGGVGLGDGGGLR